jgi:general secretion pathway protein A
MYEAHFGLNANPFSSSPSPEFIYESGEHREALAHFQFALANREAFLLLTGEVGTGKTTAVQALRRMLPEGTPVAVVTHTTLEARELLEEIALRFGLEPGSSESKPVLMRRLERFLIDRRQVGGQALLVLDEAHLLAAALLEEVRLLSNLESEGGGKLLQICLVGQPELQTHLQQPELRQLRQRITVRYALKPLSGEETAAYIYHRLMAAGCEHPSIIFPRDATQAVHSLTQGIPREINVLAGQALLNAYLDEADAVTRAHVFSAKSDYGFQGIVTGAAALTPDVSAPPTPRRIPTAPPLSPRPAAPALRPDAEGPGEPLSRPGQPSRRPIPLPPESLRPEAPPGYVEPSRVPPVLEREPAPRPGRAPARLAAGPGLGESRRRRGGRRGLTWAAGILLAAALVMMFGWWQTLNDGAERADEFTTPTGMTTMPYPGRDGSREPRADGAAGTQLPPAGGDAQAPPAGGDPETHPGVADPATGDAVQTASGQETAPAVIDAGTENRTETGPQADATQTTLTPTTPPATTPQGEAVASREDAASPPETPPEGAALLAIQVASFRTHTRADQVLADVTERTGLPGVVLAAEVDGVLWYRILLGAFANPEEARQAAEPLLRRRIIREVVTREIPESSVAALRGKTDPS